MSEEFPDVSHYQGPLRLDGAVAVIIKATQGVAYVDPEYAEFVAQAKHLGIPFAAYHWLDTTDAVAQARHAYSVVGPGVVLMIDDEQNVINVAHTLAFVTEYRRLGGCVRLEYAPMWVWENSGRPDLRPLQAAGLYLVSSNYPANGYSSTGPGWTPYGGYVVVTIWQFTDRRMFGGQPVDFNEYQGSIADLRALFTVGAPPPPPPAGGDMALTQADADLVAKAVWTYNNSGDPASSYSAGGQLRVLFGRTPTNLNAQLAAILAAASNDPATTVQMSDADRAALVEQLVAAIHVPDPATIAGEVLDEEAARIAH